MCVLSSQRGVPLPHNVKTPNGISDVTPEKEEEEKKKKIINTLAKQNTKTGETKKKGRL